MFNNARKYLVAAGALVIATSASQVFAQSGMLANAPKGPLGGPSAYLNDARNQVVKSPQGMCWRTQWWSPATAVCECDKDLMPSAACTIPVARPAPMAPKPAPMAPKPGTQKMTLAADVLFDFDRYALKPEGKAELDGVVNKIKGNALEVIIAVGHTDRIGNEAYNQKLSVRRAESVKAYLVSKGIAPNRIYAEGKGMKQPVKSCPNMKTFKETVACLAPNRRVDVEVVGTKK
ncbi:MAG: OmpA family protein [Myxococcales bacterium]|nr:MAG: OmpA family protein [Myxococcales bacterium]